MNANMSANAVPICVQGIEYVYHFLDNVTWKPFRGYRYSDLLLKILRKPCYLATEPLFDCVLHCLSYTSDIPAVENRVQR